MVQRLAQGHTAEAKLGLKPVLLFKYSCLLTWPEASGLMAWQVLYGARRTVSEPWAGVLWATEGQIDQARTSGQAS